LIPISSHVAKRLLLRKFVILGLFFYSSNPVLFAALTEEKFFPHKYRTD
jgi:hypothetical protein